jgi:hypothetical protein
MGTGLRSAIADLHALKTRFDPQGAPLKKRYLRFLGGASIVQPDDLFSYHEALCFLRAFPDDAELLRRSETELARFGRRVRDCVRAHHGEVPEIFVDSGIAGTPYHYPFGLPMARWLVHRYGDEVELDWDAYEAEGEGGIEGLLGAIVGWVETDAVDDETLSLREWFERARGARRVGFLRWLVERIDARRLPPVAAETLYNSLDLPVVWDLAESDASRTLARGPASRPYFHAGPFLGRTRDLRGTVLRAMEPVPPARAARGRMWIDLIRRALAVRERELYPVALAHAGEVYEARIGRGLTLLLIGTTPLRRLPIEADYGAFVVKNGVPIGYGVGAVLCDQAEIALNIFPTFRQGESSFVFEQLARLFRAQFGSRKLLIERYQLGHENEEGLEAGSFWFYYKLGFRPIDPHVRSLAEREAVRLARTPGARSSPATLRRLARSNVRLDLRPPGEPSLPVLNLSALSLRVSRFLEERFEGDRARAEHECAHRLVAMLGIRDLARWGEGEIALFAAASPMIVMLDGLARWSREEKRSLAQVLRAKGGDVEADYIRGLIRHPRLAAALQRLARGGSGAGSARRGAPAPR